MSVVHLDYQQQQLKDVPRDEAATRLQEDELALHVVRVAQYAAQAALDQLTAIASDSVLSKDEKPAVILDWNVLSGEQSGIDAQATAYGISGSEKTNYDGAVGALSSYLSGLSPAWNDVVYDTAIVGDTFRAKFADVYSTRQILLNLISEKARLLTATPAGSIPRDKSTAGQDFDNLWPNANSEYDPPAGADTTGAEFGMRSNVGANAYAGNWVRLLPAGTANSPTLTLACAPGHAFYIEAQVKSVSDATEVCWITISFLNAAGGSAGSFHSSYSFTPGTSFVPIAFQATAPATAVKAVLNFTRTSSTSAFYIDAIYVRRIMQAELFVSAPPAVTPGTGWTLTQFQGQSLGNIVVLKAVVTAGAGAAWTDIFHGAPPYGNAWQAMGRVYDSSAGLWYVAHFAYTSNAGQGWLQMDLYDNGASLVAPFAIGSGDAVEFTMLGLLAALKA